MGSEPWLLLQRLWEQFLVPAWKLPTVYNCSSIGSDAFWPLQPFATFYSCESQTCIFRQMFLKILNLGKICPKSKICKLSFMWLFIVLKKTWDCCKSHVHDPLTTVSPGHSNIFTFIFGIWKYRVNFSLLSMHLVYPHYHWGFVPKKPFGNWNLQMVKCITENDVMM